MLAHRGLTYVDGLKTLDENSFASLTAALAAGVEYLEIDVQATRDNVAVVFHDSTLDRVTELSGNIRELTLEQLGQVTLRNGGVIPRFVDVLRDFPNAKFNVDIKDDAAIADVVNAVREAGAQNRVLLTSFSEKRRRAAIGQLPGIASSPSMLRMILILLAYTFGVGLERQLKLVNVLQIPVSYGPIRLDSPKFIEAMNLHRIEVHYWTVNDPAEARRLVRIGARGIVTDRADLMVQALTPSE